MTPDPLAPGLQIWEALFDKLIYSQATEFGGRILSAASPSLEDVFEQSCDMDASLAERLATFAETVRIQAMHRAGELISQHLTIRG